MSSKLLYRKKSEYMKNDEVNTMMMMMKKIEMKSIKITYEIHNSNNG